MVEVKPHWRVIEVYPHRVVAEDTEGPKDKQGKFPREEFLGRNMGLGYEVGDWVGLKLHLVERPEKKT